MNRTKRLVAWGLLIVITLSPLACVVTKDPETGEKTYAVDPNKAGEVERTVDAAAIVLSLLGGIWPVLIPIGTGVVGALAAWRKMKPKLTEAQSEAKLYHTIGLATVIGIEEFKKLYPKEWDSLMTSLEKIKDKIINPEDRLKIDNLIRALRGLPPKE